MNTMFYRSSFNQDISAWDISKVESMYTMFFEASDFNQNLCAWSSIFPYEKVANSFIFDSSGCRYQDDPVLTNGGPFCKSVCQGTEGPTSSPTSSPTSNPTTMSDARSLSLNIKSSLAAVLGSMIVIMIIH